MSLKKAPKIGVVDFIHPSDSAIDCSIDEATSEPVSNLAKYRETWDFEKYCRLVEGAKPTIFKLQFNLPYRKSQAIKNATLGGDGKKEEFGFKLGNHQYQVVRSILVGIEGQDDLDPADRFSFKKTGDSLVSEETMEELEACELIEDIYSFYIQTKSNPDLLKKK